MSSITDIKSIDITWYWYNTMFMWCAIGSPYHSDVYVPSPFSSPSRQVAPRLFCDICDEFDKHDTEDCPLQAMDMDDPPPTLSRGSRHSTRSYCDICEGRVQLYFNVVAFFYIIGILLVCRNFLTNMSSFVYHYSWKRQNIIWIHNSCTRLYDKDFGIK